LPGDLQTSGNAQHAPDFVSSGASGSKAIAGRYRDDLPMDEDGFGSQLVRTDLTHVALAWRGVPIPSLAQTLFKIDLRFISKRLRGAANVSLGIADIAFARRAIFSLGRPARELLEQLQSVVERVAPACSKVKCPPRETRRLASLQIRHDHILDECKIARLLAVAKDRRLAAVAHGGDKQREHA